MDNTSCKYCGKELDEEEINTCFRCGIFVCTEDYDNLAGLCMSCSENGSYCGC